MKRMYSTAIIAILVALFVTTVLAQRQRSKYELIKEIATLSNISKPEERAKNFGLIAVAWSLGMILGPGLGGLFGQWSPEAPAYVAGMITLVNLIM